MDEVKNSEEIVEETQSQDEINSAAEDESFRTQLLKELKDASPLDTFSILEQVEMYDEKDAREIIDQVYQEFESGEHRVSNIVFPVFTSIVDGILSDKAIGQELKSKGLTVTRIVTECQNFRYGTDDTNAQIFSEMEKDRIILESQQGDFNQRVGTQVQEKYERKIYNFTEKQKKETRKANAERNGGQLTDEYTGQPVFATQEEARAAEGTLDNSAEVDHVIPLARVHETLKSNCMLSDEDVKRIANMDENFIVTSRAINNPKRDATNSEYVKGDGAGLDETTKKRMLEKEKAAQRAIDNKANQAVWENSKKNAKKLGKELGNVVGEKAKEDIKLGLGNLIIEILKPLWYEVTDSFRNGFKEGVGVYTIGDALKIRMSRIKNHIRDALLRLGIDSVLDLVKSIINSIISCIIDLFFGMLKQVLTLIRKGIPVAISAIKILCDKSKSSAERGDAVVKLLGGTVISLVGGQLIDQLFGDNVEGVMAVVKNVANCLLTGCGSLIFMALLDKLDLFSVKAEKRTARIREIFAARIAEIEEKTSCMKVDVLDLLRNQRLCFDSLVDGAKKAIAADDTERMVQYSYALAGFFKAELEYTNTPEFVRWWDQQEVVRI